MAYHKEVDVFRQKNAQANTILKKAVSDIGEYIFFCDNLNGQVSPRFQEAVCATQGIVWYGVPNATHLWQPADAGYVKLYKGIFQKEQDEWLEFDENLELWLVNSKEKLSAKQHRILLAQWVGQAHCKIAQSSYDKFRYESFERTSCLIIADGSEDDKIKPKTLGHYIVPPTLEMELSNEPVEQIISASAEHKSPIFKLSLMQIFCVPR